MSKNSDQKVPKTTKKESDDTPQGREGGKLFALIFVVSMMSLCAYAIYAGQPELAGLLGTTAIASIVGSFVYVNSFGDKNTK